MYDDIIFPNKPILEIIFLKKDDFFTLNFHDSKYQIVGKDHMLDTILIGINNNLVFLIDTDENTITYCASDLKTFIEELALFNKYSDENPSPNNPSDKKLKEYTDTLKNKIAELDSNAFYNSETYWSIVCEEIEYGI